MSLALTLRISLMLLLALDARSSAPPQNSHKDTGPNKDAASTLRVCEALSHASEYDGKMVRIQGQIVATDEGTWFLGKDCPGIFVTDGKVWPSSIAWTSPGQREFILHPVSFDFDQASLARLDKKWKKLRKQLTDRCIAVTYTGMFEAWSKANAKKTYANGTTVEIPGFGHLNGAPTQLVLKSADDVAAIPTCTGKK